MVTRYFGEVWNQGRVELLDELLHPNYTNHQLGLAGQPAGPEGLKRIILATRMAFPDLRFDVRDEVHDTDRVALRVVKRATHEGNLFGIAPTGRRVEIEQMHIERFCDGKIIEHWRTVLFANEERDRYLALQQRLASADSDALAHGDFAGHNGHNGFERLERLTHHDGQNGHNGHTAQGGQDGQDGQDGHDFAIAMVLQFVHELADGQQDPSCGDPTMMGRQLARFFTPTSGSATELPGRIRECLREAFATGANGNPEMRDVARQLGVSPRTLQRRLQQVGSSFTHEVDSVRRELACQYLADTKRPLCEIAGQLGFSEVGSFFRTFRRWTQTSPRRFRLHDAPRFGA